MTSGAAITDRVDVVVVGGGAAGLTAGLFAARAGARTRVLEASAQSGKKILISGGGRCNVLPSVFDESDYFTEGSRHVLRRLFRTWPLDRVHAFFEHDLGVPLTLEPDTGKVFPQSQKARDIRDALQNALAGDDGELWCDARVRSIRPISRGAAGDDRPESTLDARLAPERADSTPAGFEVTLTDERKICADRVILASGGRSLPRTGSDGSGYTLATALGHTLRDTYPALVPLTTPEERFRELSGIALPVRWRAVLQGRVKEDRVRELLFTHRGFSGPAMLDASHWYCRDRAELEIGWVQYDESELHTRLEAARRRDVRTIVSELLPRRLADLLCDRAGVTGALTPSQLRREQRQRLFDELLRCRLPLDGNTGYRVAEVTGGGVPLEELQPSTLESRPCPGLYLCGEILDVIGRIGGFNFLWAWVTGKLAGESAARSSASS